MAKRPSEAKDAQRGARRNGHVSIVLRWQNDEKCRVSQKVHGLTEEFCRYLDYLTTIDISCSPWTSSWYPRMRRWCERERTLSPPRKLSQIFDKNKNHIIPFFRRTREHGKDHSMKHCEQTWNDTAQIGKLTGRKLPLRHLHNNGVNMKHQTLNGEIKIGGKSDGYRLFPPLSIPSQQFLRHSSYSLFSFQPFATSGTCGTAVLFVCSDQKEFIVTCPSLFG